MFVIIALNTYRLHEGVKDLDFVNIQKKPSNPFLWVLLLIGGFVLRPVLEQTVCFFTDKFLQKTYIDSPKKAVLIPKKNPNEISMLEGTSIDVALPSDIKVDDKTKPFLYRASLSHSLPDDSKQKIFPDGAKAVLTVSSALDENKITVLNASLKSCEDIDGQAVHLVAEPLKVVNNTERDKIQNANIVAGIFWTVAIVTGAVLIICIIFSVLIPLIAPVLAFLFPFCSFIICFCICFASVFLFCSECFYKKPAMTVEVLKNSELHFQLISPVKFYK
jgi:hypothetical protein